MKVQPLGDRVLLEPIDQEEKVGSIIIPDTAKEKPGTGIVFAVGNDEDVQEKIQQGDKVLFCKYAGEKLNIGGIECLIVQASDIMAKIEGD